MRIAHPDWYKDCYLNPTMQELIELAESKWDTVRVLTNDDNDDIVLASGYGYTHESAVQRYKATINKKRVFVSSYILYHEQGVAYMNLEDVSGSQRARFEKWPFDDKHLDLFRDLVQMSGLAL